jgi:hypothetical protein
VPAGGGGFPIIDELLLNAAVLLIGAALSWLIARRFYLKSQPVKRLTWTNHGSNFVDSKQGLLGRIAIHYDGRSLAWPRTETIFIWNSGNQTISGSDVSNADPLRLSYQHATVLEVHDVIANRQAAAPKVADISPNDIRIEFDYLDPGDRIRLTVLIDGEEKTWFTQPVLQGSIRGLTHGIRNEQYFSLSYPKTKLGLFAGMTTGSIFLLLTLLICIDLYSSADWSLSTIAKGLAVIAYGFFTFAAFGITLEGRFKSTQLPHGLQRS